MSKVALVHVNKTSTNVKTVFTAVAKAMELANWRKHVKGKNIVLKVNVVWDKIYPSCTTTPMVIEGVLRVLRSSRKFKDANITIVDTDTAAIMRADISFDIQGINAMARKYNAQVVNLTNTQFKIVPFKGLVLKHLKVSKILLNADTIITMPVLKTHSYSQMTGALKNQWGCIHDLRHNYHMVLHQALADVNNFFKKQITFVVYDALFGMDGKGPKTGNPKKIGIVMASADRVAADVVACRIMGIPLQKVKHIRFAEEVGVGSTKAKVVGGRVPTYRFKRADASNLVMHTEMKLRHFGPWFEKLIFSSWSPLLLMVRWMAKWYYDIWYAMYGKANSLKMLKTNYGKMWLDNYIPEKVKRSLIS